MGKNRSGGGNWWLALLIVLPLLDYVLLRLIVISIRENRPDAGLFFVFCFQFIPQEIWLRRTLGGKQDRDKFYWAGWLCRWGFVMIGVLSAVHALQGGVWESLIIPDVYNNDSTWTAMATLPLRWIITLSGFYVIFGRKDTRKKALKYLLISLPLSLLFIGIFGTHPSIRNNRLKNSLLFNFVLLADVQIYGVAAALLDLLPGQKNRNAANQAAGQSTAGSVPPTAPLARTGGAPAAPASPAGAPRAAASPPASRVIRPAAGNTVSPVPKSIEKELKEQKAAYEARMNKQAEAKQKALAKTPPEEMLRKISERLFSEGAAAATLGGQRQLIYWMAQAVPRLGGLIRQSAGKQFFSPSLADDPDAFLPLLDTLLREAARLLALREDAEEEQAWREAEPERLCAGWYALTRFAAVSQDRQVLTEEAKRLENWFKKDKACHAWLKDTYRKTEGRERL